MLNATDARDLLNSIADGAGYRIVDDIENWNRHGITVYDKDGDYPTKSFKPYPHRLAMYGAAIGWLLGRP